MLWLMIGLLVSLGALLIAVAGAARHIWIQHAKQRQELAAGAARGIDKTSIGPPIQPENPM